MTKKILVMLLIGLMTNVVALASESKKEREFAEKVKTEIAKLGTGVEAKIKLKLKDKTKIKGYITEIKDNSFVVMDEKTNSSSEVLYSQVKQAKGNNLSTGAKIAIAVGVVAALLLITVLLVGLSE